ncbi:MAG: ABC transporter ATP-binding protein/permease [Christensenellaceae bacterium]|jgi:ATP-binding cassette subfamily B protein|nr:ABC transporter ATP-binding protein/permease [Christensenellaceae bacterium]
MIKKLLGSVREYKRESILAPLTVAAEVVLEVLIPRLMANLIDNGIDVGNMNYIIKIGLVLVGACAFALVLGALSGHFAACAAAGFSKNLRKDMYYAVQDFSFSNIDRFSTASLVTRLTTDVTNLQNSYQMIIRVAVRSPLMLLFSMIMVFSVNRRMSLIFLCVVPVLAIGLYFIMSGAHPIFTRVFKTYDTLNTVVQENLRGIRVVKTYVREDHEIKKFGEVSNTIYKDFSKAEGLVAFNMPLMQASVYTCLLLISWVGARLIVGGSMTTGDLVSIISYAMQILMALMFFSMTIVMITISRASAQRIVEVLEERSDIVNPEHPIYEVRDGSIDFRGVSFNYAKEARENCLRDIELHIKGGETVGIIGGTGAGKTTLVQLIPRLYDVTLGAVCVGGADVRQYDIETLRDAVAMVLQKNELFSGTIKENLRWGNPNATDAEMEHACRLAQADGFIKAFPDGYDTYVEQGGTNVSGGQRQRLCIARALLKKPKILIFDDSTSAVDTATDAAIRQALLHEIPDTTKIIIAQRVLSVQDADMIVVLDNGRINAVGTHAQLLAGNTIYQEVYHSQMKGGDFDA